MADSDRTPPRSKTVKRARYEQKFKLEYSSDRSFIARHIVGCLGPFRRPDCEQGRINTTKDFKRLARKLTHAVLNKELKHCRHLEDLEVNENVKGKAKVYVIKYMSKFPGAYRPSTYSP